MSLKKVAHLKKRSDFLRIAEEGYHIPKTSVVVLARERLKEDGIFIDSKVCRVGFTVTKRIGNAVVRNRTKRRLRHAVQEIIPIYGIKYFDYVIIARNPAIDRPYEKLLGDLRAAVKEIYRSFKEKREEKRLLRDIFEEPFSDTDKDKKSVNNIKIKENLLYDERNAANDLKDELADTISFSSLNINLDAYKD